MSFPAHLICALLLSNVLLRAFTNKLGILPKALNIADVFLTAWLFLIALRYYATQDGPRFGKRLIFFNAILVIGAICNLDYFYLPAAVSQTIMWSEPLLLFIAISKLPLQEYEANRFRTWLVRLLVFQLAIGVIQVPISFATGQTEAIIGTFYGNAEQYQGFIMLAVFYLIARQYHEPRKKTRLAFGAVLILCLVVLIDNKASWLGVIVSMFVVYLAQRPSLGWLLRPRHFAPILVVLAISGFVAIKLSPSIGKMSGLIDAVREGRVRDLGKIKAYDDIFHAFASHWHMAAVGTGPGNFYSRSGTQFYALGFNLSHPEQIKTISGRTSNSMGGVISLTTKNPFYAQYYIDREIFQIGSGQVDSPFSSYAALLGETGLIGLIIYLSIYGTILSRLKRAIQQYQAANTHFYPMAVATIGFMAYIMTDSLYNNWLETGRMTTIAWAMAALVLKFAPEKAIEPAYMNETAEDDLRPVGAFA